MTQRIQMRNPRVVGTSLGGLPGAKIVKRGMRSYPCARCGRSVYRDYQNMDRKCCKDCISVDPEFCKSD